MWVEDCYVEDTVETRPGGGRADDGVLGGDCGVETRSVGVPEQVEDGSEELTLDLRLRLRQVLQEHYPEGYLEFDTPRTRRESASGPVPTSIAVLARYVRWTGGSTVIVSPTPVRPVRPCVRVEYEEQVSGSNFSFRPIGW